MVTDLSQLYWHGWNKKDDISGFLSPKSVEYSFKGGLNATAYILIIQLCGNSLWKVLYHFNMTRPQCV